MVRDLGERFFGVRSFQDVGEGQVQLLPPRFRELVVEHVADEDVGENELSG
jgi:hypothetical protein